MRLVQLDEIRGVSAYRGEQGDIEPLAASMKTLGPIFPLIVTNELTLLAGSRRLKAASFLGWHHIGVRTVGNLRDACHALRDQYTDNTCVKRMNITEAYALAVILANLPNEDIRRDHRKMIHLISQGINLKPGVYVRLKTIFSSRYHPDNAVARLADHAIAYLAKTSSTEKVYGFYQEISAARVRAKGPRVTLPSRSSGLAPAAPPAKPPPTAAEQRKIIDNASAALAGLSHGLSFLGPLNAELGADEAARWARSLSQPKKTLDQLIKTLKERASAQP